MINDKLRYSLNDIAVVPAVKSGISSRMECNTYYRHTTKLPLFNAPMNNIINDENWKAFDEAGINVVLPRDDEKLSYEVRKERWEKFWKENVFVSMSMKEFNEYFLKHPFTPDKTVRKVCIDLANGHMLSLIEMCRHAKQIYGNTLIIMTGNIANPETYCEYAIAGIDYVRCGIGTGSACTTSANSAIHYPMASLIDECKKHQKEISVKVEQNKDFPSPYKSVPKIIADGGFGNFDQIIKALALGADYVMCGKLFSQCVEACTEVVADKEFIFPEEEDNFIRASHNTVKKPYERIEFVIDMIKHGYSFSRDYYGMSTKRAQREMGGAGNKTAEGIAMKIPVKYTLAGWVDNFKSYLRSAMSYTGFTAIEYFIGGPTCILISNNSYQAYFK